MKTLHVDVYCGAFYESEIKVPDEMELDEAIMYASNHLNEIEIGELNFIDGSEELNDELCYFEE